MVALQASEKGSFALWPLRTKGRTVRLNFRTPRSGLIKVEVVRPDGEALGERSCDACDPLSGDRLDQVVTWRGQADVMCLQKRRCSFASNCSEPNSTVYDSPEPALAGSPPRPQTLRFAAGGAGWQEATS